MITAGVDIGSVGTKALILEDGKILSTEIMPTGSRPKITAQMVLAKALAKVKLKPDDVRHVVSTGYGRRVVDFGEKTITEISACAQGVKFLGAPKGTVRTIIDLGGQDIKVITLDDEGNTKDFVMNDKCAAGTGRFLEVIAHALEIELAKLGELALQAKQTITINATCTVFAESEVISLLAQDVKKQDIIAGIVDSIAERIAAMSNKIGMRPTVAFTGGGAQNIGLVKSLEKKLDTEMYIPELPQFINALGSALVAQRLQSLR
ncbi:2-hydroxyglutaryl-CoA dehydratase [candidate division FCPU426 bacterium]|nr:2-hydroxyglutaryl-CoA dehydratase [candidate division FCPU426 bacterium]